MSTQFTVRKRFWPNGRVYWIVMRGRFETLVGKNGGTCKYHNKDMAIEAAKEINAENVVPKKNTSQGAM